MGTAAAPQSAIPRSATVHSPRVLEMIETISPFFTPRAIRPQAASSLSLVSCVQLTSCQRPSSLRRAAVRCASEAARWRKSCATDWTLASSLRCFCIVPSWLCAVAMTEFPLLRGVGRSVRLDPVAGPLLQAPLVRRVVSAWRVDDLLDELLAFLDLVGVGVTIGEVELSPQVLRMGAHRLGQDLGRLA